jgi:hypothetical protein
MEAMSQTDHKPGTVRAFLLWAGASAAALSAFITQVRFS